MSAALVTTFWFALWLPGYAVLRRSAPDAIEGGTPSRVALGYLASFALLSPVSIVGYAFGWPLELLSTAIVLVVAAAAIFLVRDVARTGVAWRPSGPALVVGTIIVADLLLSLSSGSHFGGDARYHVARVRMLLDYGFNSWNPLVPGQRFDPVYHGNLYHALLAAGGQLTGLRAPDVWALSWPWAKLVAASAAYHLAWVTFRERLLAWIAAAVFVVWMAPNSMLTYPNSVAPYWLGVLALAFLVDAFCRERGARPALGLAAVALVLPQVHGLYFAFVLMIAAPVLGLGWLRARIRGGVESRSFLLCACALLLGAPTFGVTLWERANASAEETLVRRAPPLVVSEALAAQPSSPERAVAVERRRERGFVRLEGGQWMLDPSSLWNPASSRIQLLLALAFGLATRRRRALGVLAAVTGIVLAAVHLPPLCTFLVEVARAPWIVRRFVGILGWLHLVVAPGALFFLLLERWPRAWLRWGCLAAAIGYAHLAGFDSEPWTRTAYLERALDPGELQARLRRHAHRRAFFDQAIPSGATVVARLDSSPALVMDCDCYRLALARDEPSHGVADMAERQVATDLLLGRELDIHERQIILRHYGVAHIVPLRNQVGELTERYAPLIDRIVKFKRMRVLVLDPERDLGPRDGSSR